MSRTDPNLFLTFDDGPIPDVTPQILSILKKFNVKATFFCIGENVKKYPEIFRQILEDGHAIGNHTYNHLNGWKTSADDYLQNVLKCDEILKSEIRNPKSEIVNLFRPPYGRIKLSQIKKLRKNFRVIMWDVLSEDYNKEISGEQCFQNVASSASNGSIIVFHDSEKARERVLYALPKVIEHFSQMNFSFKAIS